MKPEFKFPLLEAKDLQLVADAAFGQITIDESGNVNHDGSNFHITLPTPNGRIWARVRRYDAGSGSGSGFGSGSATDDPFTCDKQRYSFEEVYRVPGGCWATLPNGLVGDGLNTVAYEINDASVRDGNVYELTPDVFWVSNEIGPVQEWTFQAGGRGNGGGSGSASGSDEDNSITIPECDPVTGDRFMTTLTFSEPVAISKVAIP